MALTLNNPWGLISHLIKKTKASWTWCICLINPTHDKTSQIKSCQDNTNKDCRKRPLFNGYCRRKRIQWSGFKIWRKLFAFREVLILMRKVWIQIFSRTLLSIPTYIIWLFWEFFIPALVDGFSLEFSRQQVPSSILDSSQYSGRS